MDQEPDLIIPPDQDDLLDAALEDTFPASDPVALIIPHSHDDPIAEG